MSDCNKNRVLALYNILSKYTDIHHQMSMKEIVPDYCTDTSKRKTGD